LVVKVGVVGTGYIAEKFHIPILKSIDGVDIRALCDVDEGRLSNAARSFKVETTYKSIDDMLAREDLDLVDVLTPPDTHAKLCTKVLENGTNCLVEKPLATSLRDADNLISLTLSKHLKLNVIHNYSYVPGFVKAREMVKKGEIGEVLGVDGFYSMPYEKAFLDSKHWSHRIPGDVLGEVAPHFTMLAIEYLGVVNNVKAIICKRGTEPAIRYDELKMVLESDSVIGSVTVMLGPGGETRRAYLNIVGTNGSIYADGESQAVVRYGTLKEGWSAFERGRRAASDVAQRLASLVSVAWNTSTGHYKMATHGHRYLIQACINSLTSGASYPVALANCREEVRVLEEAFKQAPN
jgi:predicted dehydrogenase